MQIREQVLGGAHVDSIKTAQQLATLLRSGGRTEEAKKLHRQILEWQRRRDSSAGDAAWLTAEVRFPTASAVPEAFRLRSRILGNKGYSLRHITEASGAERVMLKFGTHETAKEGEQAAGPADSGHAESGNADSGYAESGSDGNAGAELPPLLSSQASTASTSSVYSNGGGGERGQARLVIQASADSALRKATELCEAHLAKLAADLAKWSHNHDKGHPRQRSQTDGGGRGGGSSGSGRMLGAGGRGATSSSGSAGSVLTLADFMTVKPGRKK